MINQYTLWKHVKKESLSKETEDTQKPSRNFVTEKYKHWKFKNSLDGNNNRKERQERGICELENRSIK